MLHDLKPKLARRQGVTSPADDVTPNGSAATPVGAELRAARERFGWSLADVSANLRIRYAHLAALEEGRLPDLPGLAYGIGFLRAYAKLLGLDPDEMSRRLRAEIGTERPTELDFPAPVPDRGVPAGVVVLLGAVLAIGAYVGWYRMSGDRPGTAPVRTVPDRLVTLVEPPAAPASPAKPAGNAEPANVPRTSESHSPAASGQPAGRATSLSVPPSSAAAAVPARPPVALQNEGAPGGKPAGQAGAPAAPAPEGGRIMLRARSDAWVQVRDRQGQVLLSRVLRAGETWQVPAGTPGRQLLLTTGNAGGTELVVDGVVAPALGPVGALKRDLPLDPALIREGKLQPQVASTNKATAAPARPETTPQ